MRRLSHSPLPLGLLLLLVACPQPVVDDVEPPDTEDTEVPDTDTELPETDDTDPPETDDTEVPSATIRSVRLNTTAYTEGDVLTVEDAIVVAVRTSGPLRGFAVQDPDETAFGGLWVGVDAGVLPVIGDDVRVTGLYQEDQLGNPGAVRPGGTYCRLNVLSTNPATSWTRLGARTVPAPVAVTVSDYASAAETWESMRVTVRERDGFRLEADGAVDEDGIFQIRRFTSSGASVFVGSPFRELADDLETLGEGDTFASISGVATWNGSRHVLGPVAASDLEDYEVFVPDTDETDDTDDTDLPETDETDTDTVIGETDSDDTFMPAETDTAGDTLSTVIPDAKLADLRAGIYTPGVSLLEVRTLVVTAVRVRAAPPNTNAFAAQDAALPGSNGGIYVLTGTYGTATNPPLMPTVGQLVTVTGRYEEVTGVTGIVPFDTFSRLYSGPNLGLPAWTVQGTASTFPTPVQVSFTDLDTPSLAEPYESMLVTLSDAAGLRVSINPRPPGSTAGYFKVEPVGGGFTPIWVIPEFYDLRSFYDVDIGDTITTLTGVLKQEGGVYRIAPTQVADAVGYVDN